MRRPVEQPQPRLERVDAFRRLRLGERAAGAILSRRGGRALAFLLLLTAAASPAGAQALDTAVCKQDLAESWAGMGATLQRLKGVARLGREEKCAAYGEHADVISKLRDALARCKTGQERVGDLAHMEIALDDVKAAISRDCPAQ